MVGLCFAFLGCLCFKVTPRYLSHLFSHMGELSIETKRIDDRQSFKRVRHRQKKTGTHLPVHPCTHRGGGHLNAQANARLAAHLREEPAPHILEDAEPTQELAGDDFTYSQETTTAFRDLLTLIDSSTRELPSVLSHAALTQLPLTYPWARLVLDLKELLVSFDRHLLTCLIANNVQGNATPHLGTVLSSFLQHLAQLLLLIIAPFNADDPPPFLHHPEIYGLEFWHAHLNYACTRFSSSHGSDRLLHIHAAEHHQEAGLWHRRNALPRLPAKSIGAFGGRDPEDCGSVVCLCEW